MCTPNPLDAIHIFPSRLRLRVLGTSKAENGGDMRKDELMNSDLLSEIVLVSSGVAILVALVMVVGAALASAAVL